MLQSSQQIATADGAKIISTSAKWAGRMKNYLALHARYPNVYRYHGIIVALIGLRTIIIQYFSVPPVHFVKPWQVLLLLI